MKTYLVTPHYLYLVTSHCDGSNERSQDMFLWRNTENYPYPSYLEQILVIQNEHHCLITVFTVVLLLYNIYYVYLKWRQ